LGVPAEVMVAIGTLVAMVLSFAAERWWPYRTDWRPKPADIREDAVSGATVMLLVDPGMKALLPILVVAWFPGTALSGWPLGIEILVVTLLIEFGKYLSHRLHHEVPLLWCLHAMHHEPQKLNTVNNFRVHPLNYAINSLAVLPALMLGASPESVLCYLAIAQPVQMLQHSNADLKNGFWNWVFSSNELHRWHHVDDSTQGHANYGNALVLWDQIFGTWRAPGEVANVGLYAASRDRGRQRISYWRRLFQCGACCASA
jgi:sterol desaturase/sphingolipid hydroxylase (fatty acid hydroxylase superfamily)